MIRFSVFALSFILATSLFGHFSAHADNTFGVRSFDADNEQAKAYLNSGSPDLAVPIFERGVAMGDVRAINNLASLYRHGQSVPKDMPKAIAMYEQASQAGLPQADFNLGWVYFGSAPDYVDLPKSRYYWQKGVDADYGPVFTLLARHYDGESEIPRDPAKVKALLERGSALGDEDSTYALAHLLITDEALGNPLEGRKLLFPLARDGSVRANLLLGDSARLGLGMKQSYVTALGYYQEAEKAGSQKAADKIDVMGPLWYSQSEDKLAAGNEIEAMAGLEVQCDFTDYLPACHKVAYVDYTGQTKRGQDIANAVRYLRKTCDLGEPRACVPYADAVVIWGPSSDRSDITRAAQILTDACTAAPPDYAACYNLAYMEYYTSFGVGSYDSMKRHVTEACFNGGYQPACPMAYSVFNSEAAARPASKPGPGALEGLLTMFADNFMDLDRDVSQASASGAYTGYSSSSSYSSSYSSSSSAASTSAAQDRRDFDNYINSVNAIGTGYNSSCPSSNPYC